MYIVIKQIIMFFTFLGIAKRYKPNSNELLSNSIIDEYKGLSIFPSIFPSISVTCIVLIFR